MSARLIILGGGVGARGGGWGWKPTERSLPRPQMHNLVFSFTQHFVVLASGIINQCQIYLFFIIKSDNIAKSRLELLVTFTNIFK